VVNIGEMFSSSAGYFGPPSTVSQPAGDRLIAYFFNPK
jgi:hypothetical protein